MKRLLKKIRFINGIRRAYVASRYYNRKYLQILRWLRTSREDTNYTYEITPENVMYLASMIAVVTGETYETVMGYINEVKHPNAGRRLGWYAFARILKPRTIIETGVDKGLGSVILCDALRENNKEGFAGYYWGIDINPQAGELMTDKQRAYGYIITGDAVENLKELDHADLFINDSDHAPAYEAAEYRAVSLSDRAVVLSDNAHCTNELVKFSILNGRKFLFFKEEPLNHWYPGAGIGISYKL